MSKRAYDLELRVSSIEKPVLRTSLPVDAERGGAPKNAVVWRR